jgi:hypothetical protein
MKNILRDPASQLALGAGITAWLAYALMTLLGPQAANTYHISGLQLVIIQITIILPVLAIWLTAIYGVLRFKQYARLIDSSPDGQALNHLTNGLIVFIVSLILQTLLGVLRRFAVGTDYLDTSVFLHNHLPLLLYLIGAAMIFQGSARLARLVGESTTWRRHLPLIVLFLLVAALFGRYFYTNLSHTVIGGIPNFSLPGKWPFYTMAIPYLAVWLIGLLSITNILAYTRKVKGILYRLALRNFAYGTMMVVSFTIILQILTFSATAFSQLSLGAVLIIVYLLLGFYAAGFALIGQGAHKLRRIEVAP